MITRKQELQLALDEVQTQVDNAAHSSGRSGSDVKVTVVTKTRPASDIECLVELGIRDFAENKDQEASAKVLSVRELIGDEATNLHWHFVGQVQSNKCSSIVKYADIVESVDRQKLVKQLDKSVLALDRPPLTCLIQVNLDTTTEASRGGASRQDVPQLAQAIQAADGLELGGVMAVAPLGIDPRIAFENLARIHEKLLQDYPNAGMMSAGMSSDFVQAIEAGATHVRLGAAILGHR